MKIKPISKYTPKFYGNTDYRRVQSETEQKKSKVTCYDLYKESDRLEGLIKKQNELLTYALASQTKYINEPSPKNYEDFKYKLINLGTGGNFDKMMTKDKI
jgi:hypothetical protein